MLTSDLSDWLQQLISYELTITSFCIAAGSFVTSQYLASIRTLGRQENISMFVVLIVSLISVPSLLSFLASFFVIQYGVTGTVLNLLLIVTLCPYIPIAVIAAILVKNRPVKQK